MNSTFSDYLKDKGGNRTTKLLTAIALIEASKPFFDKAKEIYTTKKNKHYIIKINDKETIYPLVHSWVIDQLPPDATASLLVETRHHNNQAIIDYVYESQVGQRLLIEGYEVWVSKGDPQKKNHTDSSSDFDAMMSMMANELVFTSKTLEGREALLRLLKRLAIEFYDKEYTVLKTPSKYAGWTYHRELPKRDINSIFLKKGQLEKITHDLTVFLKSEQEYVNLGLPWHRGYIFYGPPGTGKTSIAKVLANEFSLPVHYLPLGSIQKDSDLIATVSSVSSRSMLLLEDVDVYMAMTEREQNHDAPSMSAILNTLDGVYTPHGLITVMTTNNIDALDDAIIRPGRIDLQEEFDNLDQYQIDNILKYMGIEGNYSRFVGKSPAALIEDIKKVKLDYGIQEPKAIEWKSNTRKIDSSRATRQLDLSDLSRAG